MRDNQKVVHALRDLGDFANTFTPHNIGSPSMEPVAEDADDFNSDLMQIARKVDAVIEAYGEYLHYHGILSSSDVHDYFRLQLQGALEGNATFCVQNGIEDRLGGLADQAADHKRELMRGGVL